jgi:hypothetical protein
MSSGFLALSQAVRKEINNSGGTQPSPTHDCREIVTSRMLVEIFTPTTSGFSAIRIIYF